VRVSIRKAALCGAVFVAALAAYPALTQQRSDPPIARYTMDAGTISGLGAMGAPGGNPLAMLRGGGSATHELQLRLGSSRGTSGTPAADHFMPAGAQLGASVPLVTPVRQPTRPGTPGQMQQGQLPTGKLYLFWGCGERAGAGQPVVIDFARLARGEVPPDLFASGVALPSDWNIGQENSTTFGEWPNARDSKQVTAASSLLGDHRIAGNYSPEISFRLDRDFMPALQPRSAPLASGAWSLTWNGLPEATGYYAWAMGAKDMGQGQASEMVWWTSSSTRQFAGALADWLSPAAVQRLVSAGTVMPPSQTSCAIPAEARQLGGDMMMLNLYGYGPESNFAYPPRPEDTRVTWKPEWIARVRFRSNAMHMLGMPDMGSFGGAEEDEPAQDARPSGQQPQPQDALPPCPRGLAGRAMRAAGVCR
jgi:hypothetical protein